MSFIDNQHYIPHFLPYLLSKCTTTAHLLQLVTNFRQSKHFDLSYFVGESLLKNIKQFDAERHDRETRRRAFQEEKSKVQALLAKPNLSEAEKKTHNDHIGKIDFELSVLNSYPPYLAKTCSENLADQIQVAQELTSTLIEEIKIENIFQIAGQPPIRPAFTAEKAAAKLKKIVEVVLNYIESPEHILTFGQSIAGLSYHLLKTEDLYQIVFSVAERAKDRVEELKQRNAAENKVSGELAVLEAQKELLGKIKQNLPDELEQRRLLLVEDLERDYQGTRPHYDTGSADAYESFLYRAVKLVLDHAITFRKALQTPLVMEETLSKIVDWAISTLTSPSDLLEVAKTLQQNRHYMLVQTVGYRIQSVVSEIAERELSENESKEKLTKLVAEQEREHARWRVLSPDQTSELISLQIAQKLKSSEPSFRVSLLDPVTRGNVLLEVTKLMVHSVLDHFVAKKIDQSQKNAQLLTILEEIQDPVHLSELAKILLNRGETEYVLRFGEKGQERIKDIESQRELRAPLVKQINALEKEKQELGLKNKSLTADQQAQLNQAQQQLESLPVWPTYAHLFNYHQYNSLNLDVVRTMTSAILEDKVALEKRIAKLYEENDPASIDIKKIDGEREAIQDKINNLVSITLTKFPNPQSLLLFAEDMQNKDEADIVLRVGERCLERIKEFEGFLQDRIPLVRQVEHLTTKKAVKKNAFPKEKAERLASLQANLEALPALPHFVETTSIHQFDTTKLNISKLILKITATCQRNLEKKLEAASYAQNPRLQMSPKLIAEQRLKHQDRIHSVISLLERFIDNPSHLKELLTTAGGLFKSDEPANLFYDNLVLLLAKGSYKVLEASIKKAQDYDRVVRFAELLLNEKKQLDQFKKSLPESAATKLKELSRSIKDFALREQVPLLLPEVEAIRSETTKTATDTFFDLKSGYHSKFDAHDDYYKQLSAFGDQIKGQELAVMDWVLNYERNPNLLTGLVDMLGKRGEFEHAFTIGKKAQETLRELRQHRKEFNQKLERKEEMEKERDQLDKQRKILPTHKQEELRELQLEEVLFNLQPLYNKLEDHDPLFSDLLVAMIDVFDTKLQRYEDSAAMDESLSLKDIKLQKEAIVEESLDLLRSFFDDLLDVKSYISLAVRIEKKNTYRHIITIGERAEELIDQMRAQLDERSELELAYKTAEQKLIAAKIMAADGIKDEPAAGAAATRKRKAPGNELSHLEQEVEETKKRLKEIPQIKFDHEDLSRLLLQITELTIKAAKVEDRDDILLQQTILSFKADTTAERWDAVKNLCTETNWGDIKKELVVYVLKREGNPQAKIQLLMKDGLYKECLPIFPSPTAEDPEEVELLLNFFKLVEQDQPELLPEVVQTVQRYLKRYFQAFKFTAMDPLLDMVQRHYPALLVAMFTKATDMILLNILPSQYPPFIKCLKDLKHRLCIECGKPEEWDNFSTAFKARHAGKKRLIQMVSLIGDSSWDLNAIIAGTDDKPAAGGAGSRSRSPARGGASKRAKH